MLFKRGVVGIWQRKGGSLCLKLPTNNPDGQDYIRTIMFTPSPKHAFDFYGAQRYSSDHPGCSTIWACGQLEAK